MLVTGGSQGASDPVRGGARTGSACFPSISGAACRSPSNAAPRISRRSAPDMRSSASPPTSPPISRHAGQARLGAISSSRRAGASTIAELTAAGPPGDPDPAADRDRRPPDLQRPRDGQGRRRADDRADAASPRSSSPSRCRSSASSPQRSPTPRRARARSGGRSAASDLADLVERTGRDLGADRDAERGSDADADPQRSVCLSACLGMRGRRDRHRHDPLRRHRRHRHVRASPR